MKTSYLWFYHVVAIVVVLIWGVTFVNSKVLLNHGLQAHEIFTLRFLLAYVCIWTILLFLGLIASFACFALWSLVSKKIGAIATSQYVYLNPISTVVASALILHERMTWKAFLASALILVGLYWANKKEY